MEQRASSGVAPKTGFPRFQMAFKPLFDSGPLNLSRPEHFIFTFKFLCVCSSWTPKEREEKSETLCQEAGTARIQRAHYVILVQLAAQTQLHIHKRGIASDLHNLSHRVNSQLLKNALHCCHSSVQFIYSVLLYCIFHHLYVHTKGIETILNFSQK